jgi:hypothetical protein
MARKRGNGEGSIYKYKDGRWLGQYLAHTTRVSEYRYIHGRTRQLVANKLSRAMVDRNGGLIFETESLTQGENSRPMAERLRQGLRQAANLTVKSLSKQAWRSTARYSALVSILQMEGFGKAAGPGFEPRLIDPESVGMGFATVHGCSESACLSRVS